jgi:hypothetical protein
VALGYLQELELQYYWSGAVELERKYQELGVVELGMK